MRKIVLIFMLLIGMVLGVNGQYSETAVDNMHTYLREDAKTTLQYDTDPIKVRRISSGAEYGIGLLMFPNVMDSLNSWSSVDSAALIMALDNATACGNANDTVRVCRMIADEEWYDSLSANFDYLYQETSDTAFWAGGQGIHTSTFTMTNSVALVCQDSTADGDLIFIITDLMNDVKTSGTFYGLWLLAGEDGSGDLVYFDGATGFEPELYMEGTGAAAPVHLNLGY